MAVQRRTSFLSQQRVDAPDMRAIESAASNDWDQATQGFITNVSQGYILRGFEISMTGAIGGAASNLQMIMDPGSNPSAVMHILASQSGTVLQVPPGTPAQQLNSSINTNVTGAFSPNALNYIGLDYTRYLDPTTDAQVYLWDPTTNSETTLTTPRAIILQYVINVSTASWASNFLPVAIVQTDASNNVVSITDCRWLLFRLGTGGADPNPFYQYPWNAQPEGRTENPVTSSSNSINPFEGGDKMLFSLKDWMNAIMTSFLEIKGTTYWYTGSSGPNPNPNPGSLLKLREDAINTITVGQGTITHGVLPNNDPVLSTTGTITASSNQLTALASTTGLVNGLYVFGSGIPAGTTIINVSGTTVTMSNDATLNASSEAVSFYSPSVVTSPGQINWSDPFYLKVIGSALSYEIAANPTSADVLLADDEVAYIILGRDLPITPNLLYTYPQSDPPAPSPTGYTNVTSVGTISWTSGLLPGDFIRASADPDSSYAEIYSVDSATSVTLIGNYVPASQTANGAPSVYSLGSYSAVASPSSVRNIYIASRADVPIGQNTFWLFTREDVGGAVPTAYIHFLGQELAYGDSDQIDDGVPKQLLQYIGSPAESASKPNYTSALIPGSVAQVVSITTGDESTMASNQYFIIYPSNSVREYYVWVNDSGTGTDPNPIANATPIEWDVSAGQTAEQTASVLVSALNSTFFGDFIAVSSGSTVTVTNISAGESGLPTNISVGAPFTISVTQAGTGQGNYAIQDGDNLTLAIKKLDDQIASIASAAIGPGYDETVDVVSSGAVPPSSIAGPIAPGTDIQLPPNSRNSNIQVYYEVGAGKLEVFLNGQKLVVGVDYTEVGSAGAPSEYIQNSNELVDGDQLEFTFGGGGGGGGGGGEQGPSGPQGPQGPAGANATGGPVNIMTYSSNMGVSTSQNVLLMNCAGGAITLTMPVPSSATGRIWFIKKIDATANALTLTVSGGGTIDGVSSQSTTIQYYAWTIVCDGNSYYLF